MRCMAASSRVFPCHRALSIRWYLIYADSLQSGSAKNHELSITDMKCTMIRKAICGNSTDEGPARLCREHTRRYCWNTVRR